MLRTKTRSAAAFLCFLASAAADVADPSPARFAPGIISTEKFETHPAFTPDGKTLYFVRSKPNFTEWTIWQSELAADGKWQAPRVSPFSGKHADADPYVTHDGKQLWFISNRPAPDKTGRDMDIWVMDRAADGKSWGQPRRLPAPINSEGSEWFPRPTDDGTLYFGSDREGGLGATDLYRCKPKGDGYGPAENLGDPVNSAGNEFEPCISRDCKLLIFMAGGRPDELGGGDLYISRFDGAKWSTPALLPNINGRRMEIGPWLSFDGKERWYGSVSDDPKTLGDIYRVSIDSIAK